VLEDWMHKDTFTSLFLLKDMQQARKVSGHVSGIDFASTICLRSLPEKIKSTVHRDDRFT
jgi:hypothetical protein